MAKYQYRVAGSFDWMSNSGNAIVAISNPVGSGKKLTIRSFEATNLTAIRMTGTAASAASTAQGGMLAVSRATVSGGEPVTLTPFDSDASAWPATVKLTKQAAVTSTGTIIKQIAANKQMVPSTIAWMGRMTSVSPKLAGFSSSPYNQGDVEDITVKEGESLAVYMPTVTFPNSFPLCVTVTLVRSGTPNRSWSGTYFTQCLVPNQSVFSIENEAGSGETITVKRILFEEVGTFDSPYYQLVPVGTINSDSLTDTKAAVPTLKMDSNHPDPTSWIKVYKDVPLLPLGMPENAIADASTGSPKGVNYLKTKDFLGPVWRTMFPEVEGANIHAAPATPSVGTMDSFGIQNSHRMTDLLVRHSGITLREGEALALVSGAETAVVTTAVGTSGWSSWHIAAQIDVEPKLVPVLTITGLKVNSEVRVFDANTTTEVAGSEDIDSGTFTWEFDPTEHPSGVDISIVSLGYQNMRITGVSLPLADVTIPVQQQIDRQYANI